MSVASDFSSRPETPLVLPDPSPPKARFEELDALRGIAALVVVASHVFYLPFLREPFDDPTRNQLNTLFMLMPWRILWDGPAAVFIFFVLSGFVLSLPYHAGKKQGYAGYLVRRICRIYIPFAVATLTAIVLKAFVYHGPIGGPSDLMYHEWKEPTTWLSVLKHLTLIVSAEQDYDPVTWTLTHEMRASLLFPLLMIAVVRLNPWLSLGLTLVAMRLSMLLGTYAAMRAPWLWDWTQTVIYLLPFVVGSLLARYRSALSARYDSLPPTLRWSILILGIGLLAYRVYLPPFIKGIPVQYLLNILGAAILVLTAVAHAEFSSLLRMRWAEFLGRISYSLYLVHFLVLLGLYHGFRGRIPTIPLMIVSTVLSIAIAWLSYQYVEVPSMNLGRALSRRIEGRTSEKARP